MAIRSESHFLGFDQSSLYYQKWSCHKPRATLIITHGQAEHSGCYHRLIEAVEDLHLDIYAWDLRGHGKSSGLRGYAQEFADYAEDFKIFLKKLTQEQHLMAKPLCLLAHSMGGLVQAKVLSENPALPVTAQVLSSPMFGISVQVPAIKDIGAKYLNLLLPKLTLGNEIQFTDLTRDLSVLKEFELDVLRHDRISAGVYLGAQTAMSELRAKAAQIQTPTLMLLAENDPVVSSPAGREVFSSISAKHKVLNEYPDRKHELFNDLGREEVFSDLRKYLQSII